MDKDFDDGADRPSRRPSRRRASANRDGGGQEDGEEKNPSSLPAIAEDKDTASSLESTSTPMGGPGPRGGRRAVVTGGWGSGEESKSSGAGSGGGGEKAKGGGGGSSSSGGFFKPSNMTTTGGEAGGRRRGSGLANGTQSTVQDDEDGQQDESRNGNRRKGRSARDVDEGDETEIMVIPDLDDDLQKGYEEEVQVAVAPRNVVRRLKTLRELDSEIKHVITSAAAPGLDLSLLTQYLVPYEVAKGEEDVPWMFDELLEELTQDLHAEMEKKGALAISSSSINKGVKDKENDGRLGNASTKAGGGGVSAVNSSSRPSRLATLLSEAK